MGEACTKITNEQWLEETYQKLLAKMKKECERIGTMIPYSTRDGKYHDLDVPGGIYFWTNGFWPGMLWQMYEATGDEAYKKAAEGVEERLDETLQGFEGLHHDVGFMFLLSSVANYRITKNMDSRRRSLHAANLLAGRYNLAGKFIRAWNDDMGAIAKGKSLSGGMIIDCLMNIPLLYWASEETKDPRYTQIAVNHAKTAQQYIVRPDGSCNHIVIFDPETGEFLDNPGGQGFEKGSSWSRGQSWAVYGFALSYRHTGDESFLATAKRCAHYCISNMAVSDWLPLVDYRAPEDPVKYDSTAGMITACGLIELAKLKEGRQSGIYLDAALKMLKALTEKSFNWNEEEDELLTKCSAAYHEKEHEFSIIYGDYYFLEALMKLTGKELFIW